MGNKPRARWLLGVLDRCSNQVRLLDIGSRILKQIQVFVMHPQWGDPDTYDIEIHISDDDWRNRPYAIAMPKIPLSKDEIDLKEAIDLKFLEEICRPKT